MKDEFGWRSFDRWDFDECRNNTRVFSPHAAANLWNTRPEINCNYAKPVRHTQFPSAQRSFPSSLGGIDQLLTYKSAVVKYFKSPLEKLQLLNKNWDLNLKQLLELWTSSPDQNSWPSDLTVCVESSGTSWKFYYCSCYFLLLPTFPLHLNKVPKRSTQF